MKTATSVFSALLFIFLQQTAVADADRHHKDKDKVEGELSVMVLGSGGPIATAAGRASAGYMVFTDGKPRLLMDLGGGTYQRLAASGYNIHDMDTILLSHLHLDHTGDLAPIIKTIYFHNNLAGTRRSNPINIYGPAANGVPFPNTSVSQYPDTSDYAHRHFDLPDGTDRYLNLFASAISGGASQFSYQAHDLHSTVAGASMETVIDADDGLRVSSIAVDHGPVPGLAFRIDYKGHSIVYSGDTASTGPNMINIAQDADVLIYDTAITDDLPLNPVFHMLHTSPTRIGEVATAANVKKLLLSHITPVTESRLKSVKRTIRRQGFNGRIRAAQDLQVYNLGHDD